MEQLVSDWDSARDELTMAGAELRTAVGQLMRGDPSTILPATVRFTRAREGAAAADADPKAKRAALEQHEQLICELNGVSAAFHEAAHILVAHTLDLRVLRATLAPAEDAYASCEIAPFSGERDGSERAWLLRFATTLYAGVAGNACVGPISGPTISSGHCESDGERAKDALRRAGRDPDVVESRFSFLAWLLVDAGRASVFALALSLLRTRTIEHDLIISTIDRSLKEDASRRLEQLKSFIHSI